MQYFHPVQRNGKVHWNVKHFIYEEDFARLSLRDPPESETSTEDEPGTTAMPRFSVTPQWVSADFFVGAGRADITKRDELFDISDFIELIELYGESNYTIKHKELEAMREQWRASQQQFAKTCKDKYHPKILEGEELNWDLFAKSASIFDKTAVKSTSGYVETVYATYLLYKMFWEASTGFKYQPGNRYWVNGCSNPKCKEHIDRSHTFRNGKADLKFRPGDTATFNIFMYASFDRYFNNGLSGKDYGILATRYFDKHEAVPEGVYEEYPALRKICPGWYFTTAHFAARVYHFGVKYNFWHEYDLGTSKTVKKPKAQDHPCHNKMVGVPVGVVEDDPTPARVVIARFEETEQDLVLKYFTIPYTVHGRYLAGRDNLIALHGSKETTVKGLYYGKRNSHRVEGVAFFYEHGQGSTKRSITDQDNERKGIWNQLCVRGWKDNYLFALPAPAAGSFRGTENSPFYKKWTSSAGKKDRENTDLAMASREVAPALDDDSPSPTLTPQKPKTKTLGLMKTTPVKSTQVKNALAQTPTSKISKTLVPKGTPTSSTKKSSKSKTSTLDTNDSPSDKDKAKSQSSKILSAKAKATLKELKIAELRRQIEELEKGSTDDEEPPSPEPEQVQEREDEPYSKNMYEGLDPIAAAEFYNFLGRQHKSIRKFFTNPTSAKYKCLAKDTEERDEARKTRKGKGKAKMGTTYNPNIPLVHGWYRSNDVLQAAIAHYHSNKGHLSSEIEAIVPSIVIELTPMLGVSSTSRGLSQIEDATEYFAEVARGCEGWWVLPSRGTQ
jgi:hypothetical protein